MSEAAGAGGGASAGASAATSTGGQAAAPAATPGTGQSQSQGAAQRSTAGSQEAGSKIPGSQNNQPPGAAANAADDGFEEIVLGSVKSRVPKDVAKAVKDYERGIQQKFRDAADARKRLETLEKADLAELAKMRGQNFEEMAENLLAEKYKRSLMSPEQQELADYRAANQTRAQQENQFKDSIRSQIKDLIGENLPAGHEKATIEQLQQAHAWAKDVYTKSQAELNRSLAEAWKQTGLPERPFYGAQMAFMMKSASSRGETLQPAEAAAKVKQNFQGDVRGTLEKMDPQGIHEFLGDVLLQKIRDYDIQRVTGKTASGYDQQQSPGHQPASEPTQKKQLNQIEWRKAMGIS